MVIFVFLLFLFYYISRYAWRSDIFMSSSIFCSMFTSCFPLPSIVTNIRNNLLFFRRLKRCSYQVVFWKFVSFLFSSHLFSYYLSIVLHSIFLGYRLSQLRSLRITVRRQQSNILLLLPLNPVYNFNHLSSIRKVPMDTEVSLYFINRILLENCIVQDNNMILEY